MKTLWLSLLLTTSALAHELHDWREDYVAYLMVEQEVIPQNFGKRFFSIPKVDMNAFKAKLAVLTGVSPVPGTNKTITERRSNQNLDLTRAYLADEYKKLGFEVSLHPFGSGTNLIAEKKGTKYPEKVLVLSSHIDSVGNRGANDDGTGTIAALMMAEVLAQKNYDYTIRILGFDREENGLTGSAAYVPTIREKQNIIGNINLEMMGFHSKNDGAFHVIDCDSSIFGRPVYKEGSDKLSALVKKTIADFNLDLKVIKTCTGRSDHASFWKHKIPAIVISENFFGGDPDPCYHAKCDVMDGRINYDYMGKILSALLGATESLLTHH